jgi:hypothetical protein
LPAVDIVAALRRHVLRRCTHSTQRPAKQEACAEGDECFFTVFIDNEWCQRRPVGFVELSAEFRVKRNAVDNLREGFSRTFKRTGPNTTGNTATHRALCALTYNPPQRRREATGDKRRCDSLTRSLDKCRC